MRAQALIAAASPKSADLHLVQSGVGGHALVVDGSRFYNLDADAFEALSEAIDQGVARDAIEAAGLAATVPAIGDDPLKTPPIHALSLAVAQACNLGCAYCYAREGGFGGAPKAMPLETAKSSVDVMLADKRPGEHANLAFMGGEPLLNREVLRETTRYAAHEAEKRQVQLGFSITTNGTLLDESDADFFEAHAFAVTVSLDGPPELHDRLRPFKGGRGSFERIQRAVEPLLARQRHMQVSARVTVTPQHGDLPGDTRHFIQMGFHSVGFSPMLSAPNGREEMSRADLTRMLDGMVACGIAFERHTRRRRALSLRQHAPSPSGNPAWHASPLSLRGGCRLFRRLRKRRSVRVPSLRRQLRRQDGIAHGRGRSRTASGVARRTPCASSVPVQWLLGALSLRRGMPPRNNRAASGTPVTTSAACSTTAWASMPGCRRRGPRCLKTVPLKKPDLHADVLIGGAGPAGVALAMRLKRLGHDVVLVAGPANAAHEFEMLNLAAQERLAFEGLSAGHGIAVEFESRWGPSDF